MSGGDFPTPKLDALQRILTSDFLRTVRQVYENIYETVDIRGSPEVRANATAKVRSHWLLVLLDILLIFG